MAHRREGRDRPPDRDRDRTDEAARLSRSAERPLHKEKEKAQKYSDISGEDSSSDEEEERRRRDRKKEKHKEKLHKERTSSHRHHKKEREKSSKSDRKNSKEEEKKRRRKRKRRSKHSSSSDDESGSDSETSSGDYRKKKRLQKAAKKLLKKHESGAKIVPMEPALAGLKVDNISEDDYFAKSVEFAMWLKEGKGLFFSNLTSEETHKLFGTFVEIWNGGKLSAKYYQGIKAAPRSTHKWGIKLDRNENALLLDHDQDDIMNEKKLQKLERKKFNKDQEVLMDELLPKATGREALLEKKALRRERTRGREDSPEIFKERDVMGGGDDFQKRLARERAWREKKAAAKSDSYLEKKSAFDEREAAAMNQFKAIVNMSGGKMVIPKRT